MCLSERAVPSTAVNTLEIPQEQQPSSTAPSEHKVFQTALGVNGTPHQRRKIPHGGGMRRHNAPIELRHPTVTLPHTPVVPCFWWVFVHDIRIPLTVVPCHQAKPLNRANRLTNTTPPTRPATYLVQPIVDNHRFFKFSHKIIPSHAPHATSSNTHAGSPGTPRNSSRAIASASRTCHEVSQTSPPMAVGQVFQGCRSLAFGG